jgi:hypothetical protein
MKYVCYEEVNLKYFFLANWTSKIEGISQIRKVKIFWEGHKIWKKSPNCFDITKKA